MKPSVPLRIGIAVVLLATLACSAEVKVTVDHNPADQATPKFTFKSVPSPVKENAAAKAKFSLADGQRDESGAQIGALSDGKLPTDVDQPESNFFFTQSADGGRIELDLGSAIDVKQINTYSWHADTRAPQVYNLYGSDGSATDFNAKPKKGTDPTTAGWNLIAKVDTRPKTGAPGGQYGVSIADSGDATVGNYRYLLFDVFETEGDDAFGNTFYSEINVIDKNAKAGDVASATQEKLPPFIFHSHNPDCEILIDTSAAPDLKDWVQNKLGPTLAEWYPKIAEMLPSDGYAPPKAFTVLLRPGNGVAATGGTRVTANSDWLRREMNREATGALVHEEVHVVQQYGYGLGRRRGATTQPAGAAAAAARRPTTRPAGNPVWLVEGIADYVRWWYYEPDSPRRYPNPTSTRTKYDGSYTISANFLHWVAGKYDKDIVKQMNAAMRERRYSPDLWREYTGKTVQELGDEWKKELPARKTGA
jgi:hypothetical protein